MKSILTSSFVDNLILPCYSQISKNILWAVFNYLFSIICKIKTNFKWAYYPEFIYELAPDGSLVVPNVNANDKSKEIKWLANQLKHFLKSQMFLYKPVYDKDGSLVSVVENLDLEAVDTDRNCIFNDIEVMAITRESSFRILNVYKNSFIINNEFNLLINSKVKKPLIFTIKQAWILYFYLIDDVKNLQKFSAKEIEEVVGKPKNPFEIEKTATFIENCKMIINEYDEYCKNILHQEKQQIDKIKIKFDIKRNKKRNNILKNINKIADKMKIK